MNWRFLFFKACGQLEVMSGSCKWETGLTGCPDRPLSFFFIVVQPKYYIIRCKPIRGRRVGEWNIMKRRWAPTHCQHSIGIKRRYISSQTFIIKDIKEKDNKQNLYTAAMRDEITWDNRTFSSNLYIVFYEESCVNKHFFGVKVVEVNTRWAKC